jgi:DNA-binding IscR family transcriptional regulator
MQLDVDSPEAHARMTIVHAFTRGRGDVWTPESLASSFGISKPMVIRVLAELQAAGIVRRLPGPDEEFSAAGSES